MKRVNPMYDAPKRLLTVICTLFFALWCASALAQSSDALPINADTVSRLRSALTIDFDTQPAPATGLMASGWLRLNVDGQYLVGASREQHMIVWDTTDGEIVGSYQIVAGDGRPMNFFDASWAVQSPVLHTLHGDGQRFVVGVYDIAQGELTHIVNIPLDDAIPVRVWADDDALSTWVEVIPNNPNDAPYILNLALADGQVLQRLPSVAEADRTSQVRLGRMPAPLAITAAPDGTVHLWDLELGEQLATANVAVMPAFGHMNGANQDWLAWRDPMSEALYLLNFATGQNQQVARLDGQYVQGLLLGSAADVMVGVNVDFAPVGVAWEVASGEMLSLGEYRSCGRTPDMIQMNHDGTVLAIGCDTGFDIWRVERDAAE